MYSIEWKCTFKIKKNKKNLGYVQISHLIIVFFFFQKSYLNNNFSIYIKQYYDYII